MWISRVEDNFTKVGRFFISGRRSYQGFPWAEKWTYWTFSKCLQVARFELWNQCYKTDSDDTLVHDSCIFWFMILDPQWVCIINNCIIICCRYSSVDSSAPTPGSYPNTPSTLLSIYIWIVRCEEDENKQKRGRDWPVFEQQQLHIQIIGNLQYERLYQKMINSIGPSCSVSEYSELRVP